VRVVGDQWNGSGGRRGSGLLPTGIQIACTVVEGAADHVMVSTAEPWGLESIDGTYEFLVQNSQVFDRDP